MLQQNIFELEEWLALLPFSDRPEIVIDTVGGLPDQTRHPSNLHRLLSALAYAPGSAHRILLQLAERDVSFYGEYEWLQALKAHSDLDAVEKMLDLLADGKIAGRRGGIATSSLARELAGGMDSRPGLQELLRNFARNGVGAAKTVAMMALTEAPSPSYSAR